MCSASEAERYYLDALAVNPGYVHALQNLGGAYYEQGRLDDGIRAFQKTLELYPENKSARENLGALLEEKLEHRLFDLGLLKGVRKPIRDFAPYANRTPVVVRGKPLSEIIVEDRR
ncbi:MAG: tetratricopeptide repeat protein [Pyrinomonadaceae bacterium]